MTMSAETRAIGAEEIPGRLAVAPAVPVTVDERASVPSGTHIGALDGIRGLAILLVLAFHFGRSARMFGISNPILQATEIGWVGVDLFFVLSGFLITGILYDSRMNERYYRNFYARRSLRIFPLYYGALLVTVVLGMLWPEAEVWSAHSPAWIAFYTTNFLMASEGTEAAGILGHFWSLAVEEHFYLLWPLFVRWGTRRQLMAVSAALIVMAFALRITLVFKGVDPEAIYILTPTRFDALATGAFCSLAVRGAGGPVALMRVGWITLVLGGAGMLVLILSRHTLSNQDPVMQTVGFTMLSAIFASVIVIGLTGRLIKGVLENGVLRWFGRYSYGIYIWHPIIAVILFNTQIPGALGVSGPHSSALMVLLALALSILTAVISYRYWEQPFLRLKRSFA